MSSSPPSSAPTAGSSGSGLSTLADIALAACPPQRGDASSANGVHPRVPDSMTLRDALSTLLLGGGVPLVVLDGAGRVKGRFTLDLVGGVLRDGDGGVAC